MTRWGVGPIFAAGSVIFVALLIAINDSVLSELTVRSNFLLLGFGGGLIAVGVVIFVVALHQVHSAFNSRELVTKGVYAYMRDPVYAVWILFIVPGLMLTTGMLLLVIAPLLMYWLHRALIGKEEEYLELTFGKKYLDYKSEVNSVIPRLNRKSKVQGQGRMCSASRHDGD